MCQAGFVVMMAWAEQASTAFAASCPQSRTCCCWPLQDSPSHVCILTCISQFTPFWGFHNLPQTGHFTLAHCLCLLSLEVLTALNPCQAKLVHLHLGSKHLVTQDQQSFVYRAEIVVMLHWFPASTSGVHSTGWIREWRRAQKSLHASFALFFIRSV